MSGRCPRTKVGLPPDPVGKGTDPCSMWTPSSAHSTSSLMTSAAPTAPNSDAPAPRPPFPRARSSRNLRLHPMVEIRQRARLLPLRPEPSARCVPHPPARPSQLSVQPARALPCRDTIEEIALHLASGTDREGRAIPLVQALDASAMPVRDAKRRGNGWLTGYAYASAGPTAWAATKASPF